MQLILKYWPLTSLLCFLRWTNVILPQSMQILTITHILLQYTCSKGHWKHIGKIIKQFFKWKHYYWTEIKTFWQKEKLLNMSNFNFATMFSKVVCCRSNQKASACRKKPVFNKPGWFNENFSLAFILVLCFSSKDLSGNGSANRPFGHIESLKLRR